MKYYNINNSIRESEIRESEIRESSDMSMSMELNETSIKLLQS